ncbi:MAG TPA: cytosine permease [Gaiellaceae bacterium]|jgi:purine-cytosine permease-like protein
MSEITHEVASDLEFEREELHASIEHDYSTTIVPLEHRRPMWHFLGLWTTFVAGFSYMALGFEIYDGGFSLAKTVGVTVLGYGIYAAYAMVGSYLGSRTGQTHSLLTRSIFGSLGSGIVSLFVLIAPLGWVGYQAGLLAQIWDGFYPSWGHLKLFTIVLAAVMIFNNVFGFTGISVFARYLVTPILIAWALYMVIKGFVSDGGHLGGSPTGSLPYWVAVGAVIGFSMWGNEPDFWRYGKPSFTWALPTYLFSLVWFLLFVMAGWMMSQLAHSTDQSAIFRFTTHYSLFGLFWLAFVIATISQFAINDGNYYESVNAGQNLLGWIRGYRRIYTCALVAVGGAVAADLVNFHFVNGWFDVATFLAITVPCATTIMAVDHFLLPRWFRISRPLDTIPAWDQTRVANWPAIISLLAAVAYGAIASGILPGGLNVYVAARNWGPVPLECWAGAGALYAVLVALTRAVNVKDLLGFPHTIDESRIASDAVIDIASGASLAAVPAPATART